MKRSAILLTIVLCYLLCMCFYYKYSIDECFSARRIIVLSLYNVHGAVKGVIL